MSNIIETLESINDWSKLRKTDFYLWRQKDGEVKMLYQMDTPHIKNAIASLERNKSPIRHNDTDIAILQRELEWREGRRGLMSDRYEKEPDQCDVYWGSHGCNLQKNHKGWHDCECCEDKCINGCVAECVSQFPYYGERTEFYGGDAPAAQEKFDKALGLEGGDE